jgi:hypothetical protein
MARTEATVTGSIKEDDQYYRLGPWHVELGTANQFWRIIHQETGTTKKIGRVGGRVNYYKRAVNECIRRNRDKLLKEQKEYFSQGGLK